VAVSLGMVAPSPCGCPPVGRGTPAHALAGQTGAQVWRSDPARSEVFCRAPPPPRLTRRRQLHVPLASTMTELGLRAGLSQVALCRATLP